MSPLFEIERSLGLFDTWPGLILPCITFSLVHYLDQDSDPGVPDVNEPGDLLGRSVATASLSTSGNRDSLSDEC